MKTTIEKFSFYMPSTCVNINKIVHQDNVDDHKIIKKM